MLSKVETCSETLCRGRAGLPARTTVMALLGVLGVEGSIVLKCVQGKVIIILVMFFSIIYFRKNIIRVLLVRKSI